MSDEQRDADQVVIAEFLALLAATDNQVDMFDAALLRELDRLTAERDQAREQLAKLRSVIWSAYADAHAYLYTANGTPEKVVAAYETLKAAYENIRAALGIESEAGE